MGFMALVRLAGPLAIAEIATMLGGVATTMMLGRLGAEALGVQGLASILFINVAIFGFDLLLGLDYPTAHAVGAGRLDEALNYLVQGCWLAALLTVLLTTIVWYGSPLLVHAGLSATLLTPTLAYLRIVSLGLLPVLIWIACRRYLQARGRVHGVMLTLLGALGLEVFVKWVLIFGRLGAPALGVEGAAWGAVIEFTFVGIVGLALVWMVTRHDAIARPSFAPEFGRLRELIRLGLPAGTRSAVEVGFIAAVTTLAARVDTTSLAAHQITLNLASLTFMIPLGLSAGTAVQVGNALGAGDPQLARRAGWTGIVTGAGVMTLTAIAFTVIPQRLLHAYTADPTIVAIGVPLLWCAAAFQLFDGVQVMATGALRGSGDTRTPLVANLIAHWGIGLPLGWLLCFHWSWGVVGLWIGLSTGLILVGSTLVLVWAWRARRLAVHQPPSSADRDPNRLGGLTNDCVDDVERLRRR